MKTLARILTATLCLTLLLTLAIPSQAATPGDVTRYEGAMECTMGGEVMQEQTADGQIPGSILYVTEGENFQVHIKYTRTVELLAGCFLFRIYGGGDAGFIDYLEDGGEYLQTVSLASYLISPVDSTVSMASYNLMSGMKMVNKPIGGDMFILTGIALEHTKRGSEGITFSIAPSYIYNNNENIEPYDEYRVDLPPVWKRIVVLCKNHEMEVKSYDGTSHIMQCKNCPYEEAAHQHDWDDGQLVPGTGCQNPDKTVYTCTTCSFSKTSYGEAQHSYDSIEKLNTVHHAKKCACGKYITEEHNWDSGKETTKPSCSDPGVKTFTCTDCGETKTQSIAATGHSHGKWEKLNETQHAKKCSCGDIVKADHNWNKGSITAKPSCSAPGVKTFTCTDCGETKTETLPETAHTYTNSCDADCNICGNQREIAHKYSTKWASTKENHYHKCSVCGSKADEAAHTPSDWIIDKAAAPAVAGSKHTECTVCKRVLETQQLPALECKHQGGTAIAGKSDPTCEEDGNTGNTVCAICQTILTPGQTIPATGHRYELIGQKDATCTDAGYTGDEICQNCQDVRLHGEDTPASGHTYENGICHSCGQAEPTKPAPENPTAAPAAESNQQSKSNSPVLVIAICVITALTLGGTAFLLLRRKKHN